MTLKASEIAGKLYPILNIITTETTVIDKTLFQFT